MNMITKAYFVLAGLLAFAVTVSAITRTHDKAVSEAVQPSTAQARLQLDGAYSDISQLLAPQSKMREQLDRRIQDQMQKALTQGTKR